MFKYLLSIFIRLYSFSKRLLAQNYQFQKATYEIVEDSILVEKGKTIWQIEPPVYEITIEKRMYAPRHNKWIKVPVIELRQSCFHSSNCKKCKVWRLVSIPAKYKHYKKKTLKTLAHF